MEKHGGKIDRNVANWIKLGTFGDDKLKLGAEKNGMWTKPFGSTTSFRRRRNGGKGK